MEARERFINDHGRFLPDDLCPYIPDQPLMFVVDREGSEGTITLDENIVAEVRSDYCSRARMRLTSQFNQGKTESRHGGERIVDLFWTVGSIYLTTT